MQNLPKSNRNNEQNKYLKLEFKTTFLKYKEMAQLGNTETEQLIQRYILIKLLNLKEFFEKVDK